MSFARRWLCHLPLVACLIVFEGLHAPVFAQSPSGGAASADDDSGDMFLIKKRGSSAFSVPVNAPLEMEWGIPPIPWRGAINLSGGVMFPADQARSYTRNISFAGQGQTYVWQPWFLKVNGGGALAKGESSSSLSSAGTTSYNLGGSGLMLAGTRYPFSLSTALTGSSAETFGASGMISAATTRSTNIGLSQIYSPWNSAYSTSVSYNWLQSRVASEYPSGVPVDKVESQFLSATLAVPLHTQNPQSANANFRYATATGTGRPGRSSSDLGASHAIYLEDYVMDVSTGGSVSHSQQGAGASRSSSNVYSLASVMSWIPSDDYPLSVNGNAGYFLSSAGQGAGTFDSSTFNVGLGGAYPFNKNWRANANVFAVNSRSRYADNDASLTAYSANGTLSWGGDGISTMVNGWSYSLSYGGGLGVGYGGGGMGGSSATATMGVSQGQSIGRGYRFDESLNGSIGFNQSLGVSVSSAGEFVPPPITHGFTANFSGVGLTSSYGYGVSANDSRTLGGNQATQQLTGNAQFQRQVSAYANLNASGVLNYSSQNAYSSNRNVIGGFVGAGYSNQRFANTSGLNYQARYSLTITQSADDSGDGFVRSHSINQSWSWRFGLLGWTFQHAASAVVGGALSQSVLFTVTRDFSGVL